MDETRKRRACRAGEALAIDPSFLVAEPGAFFFDMGPVSPPNEWDGDVCTVHIRGPLEHHDDGFLDSHDAILARLKEALAGKDGKPTGRVVLRIDSPGGVVSGCFESVAMARRMAAAAKVPVDTFVDEMAASAGYAWACVGDCIYAPPSAILGSIGVRCVIASQSEAEKAMGLDVRLITSGERKGDGDPHAPITDAAMKAAQGRVDELAAQFFAVVAASRGIPVEKVAAQQAGVFLGAAAKKAGLSDGVVNWEGFVKKISLAQSRTHASVSRETKSRLDTRKAPRMSLKIAALIASLTTAFEVEKDPDKKLAIGEDLSAAKRVEKLADADEEPAAAPPVAAPVPVARPATQGSPLAVALAQITGETTQEGIIGVLRANQDKANAFDALNARVATLEAERAVDARTAQIDAKLKGGFIDAGQAEWLRGQPLATVASYLKTRTVAIITTMGEEKLPPAAGASGSLSDDVLKSIDEACSSFNGDKDKLRADLVKAHTSVASSLGSH